jgi:hypothetical protein
MSARRPRILKIGAARPDWADRFCWVGFYGRRPLHARAPYPNENQLLCGKRGGDVDCSVPGPEFEAQLCGACAAALDTRFTAKVTR